jgi:hypothetical protein
MNTMMKTIPPTTPPIMAPIGLGELGVCPGKLPISMHTVEAHSVHDSAFKEQV